MGRKLAYGDILHGGAAPRVGLGGVGEEGDPLGVGGLVVKDDGGAGATEDPPLQPF